MKRVGAWLVLLIFGITVTGCATAQQQSGFDPGTEVAKGAGVGAVLGALGGAAAGAAIGAATGNAGRGAAIGAATGGIGGGVVGASGASAWNRDGYDRAYAACMSRRGYGVR